METMAAKFRLVLSRCIATRPVVGLWVALLTLLGNRRSGFGIWANMRRA